MATLPSPVEDALADWIGPARDVLGAGLRAVLLGGGLALGDFAPRWSDVDVALHLAQPPAPAQVEALRSFHAALHADYVVGGRRGWASGQFIEGPLLVGSAWQGPGLRFAGPRLVFVERVLDPWERLVLARAARTLEGEAPPITAPSGDALRVRMAEDLQDLLQPVERSGIWMTGMIHWMARSLAWWGDHVLLSKTEALARRVAGGGRGAEAFRLGLELREAGSRACAGELSRIRRALDDLRAWVPARLVEAAACKED